MHTNCRRGTSHLPLDYCSADLTLAPTLHSLLYSTWWAMLAYFVWYLYDFNTPSRGSRNWAQSLHHIFIHFYGLQEIAELASFYRTAYFPESFPENKKFRLKGQLNHFLRMKKKNCQLERHLNFLKTFQKKQREFFEKVEKMTGQKIKVIKPVPTPPNANPKAVFSLIGTWVIMVFFTIYLYFRLRNKDFYEGRDYSHLEKWIRSSYSISKKGYSYAPPWSTPAPIMQTVFYIYIGLTFLVLFMIARNFPVMLKTLKNMKTGKEAGKKDPPRFK
uniref:Uncharacterized protein n=1 Tax=Ditylenchus dipsaci TaxID=166011 RepID=A0A915DT94_9BILA